MVLAGLVGLLCRRQQLTEAEKRQAREDRLADNRNEVWARCQVAAEQIAALGNETYPRIAWRPFAPQPFLEKYTVSFGSVQLILSCPTAKWATSVTLELAEDPAVDRRDLVRMLAKDFAQGIAERLLSEKEAG